MKYYSKKGLLINIFLIVMGCIALDVSVEYLMWKRNDGVEFIVALFMFIFLAFFGPRKLEIDTDKKEIYLTRWYGVYGRKYKAHEIKDLYVEYCDDFDKGHEIIATIGHFNIVLYEYGAFKKEKVIDKISEVYNLLSDVTGIAKRDYILKQ